MEHDSAPAISIVMSVYNAAPTLGEALASIFAQTFNDWELIVADDGSTDETATLLRRMRDPRVRLIVDGERQHLARRLNQAIGMARGKYVARMDGDDVMHPERLARQLAFIEQRPEVDVIDSAVYLIDRSTNVFAVFAEPIREPDPAAIMIARRFLAHPAVFARNVWFRQNQYSESPDFERCEDLELWIRSLLAGRLRVARVREPLLFYRVSDFDFARYRAMTAGIRCITRRYGPEVLGSARTARLIARLWGDEVAHQIASSLKCEELLFRAIRRRGRSYLGQEETARAQRALHEAITAPIPGWNVAMAIADRHFG
jgi:glycosyltransferase involved in cell wall biosynthesis